jgi:hypothetical protein
MDVSKQLKKFQEGVIAAALIKILPGRESEIYWNKKICDHLVNPDLTVGVNPEVPEIIICVAHSDSEKESDKKFWRNMAELTLAKARLPLRPLLISILFEEQYKPGLMEVMGRGFDAQIRLLGDLGLERLVSMGPSMTQVQLKGVTDPKSILKVVTNEILADELVAAEFVRFSTHLENLLFSSTEKNKAYWKALQSVSPPAAELKKFEFKTTGALRRGVSKLMCFDESVWCSVLDCARDGGRATFPAFALGLGWLQETALKGKQEVFDKDLISLARAFPNSSVIRTLNSVTPNVRASMRRVAVDPCREFGQEVLKFQSFFGKEIDQFQDQNSLAELIEQGFSDPSLGGRIATERRWLLDFILAAGKAIPDRAQGFGLSKLADQLSCSDPHKVRFWFPKYNAGKSQLPAEVIVDVARVAAPIFSKLIDQYGSASSAGAMIAKWMVHTLVEVKLCTYRLFKPAELLVAAVLHDAEFTVNSGVLQTSSVFARGNSARTTSALIVDHPNGNVLVKVQSGAKNTHDKAKELCGRIGLSLKMQKSGAARPFAAHILVLDGPFTRDEAAMCRAAGWDEVIAADSLTSDSLRQVIERSAKQCF